MDCIKAGDLVRERRRAGLPVVRRDDFGFDSGVLGEQVEQVGSVDELAKLLLDQIASLDATVSRLDDRIAELTAAMPLPRASIRTGRGPEAAHAVATSLTASSRAVTSW